MKVFAPTRTYWLNVLDPRTPPYMREVADRAGATHLWVYENEEGSFYKLGYWHRVLEVPMFRPTDFSRLGVTS